MTIELVLTSRWIDLNLALTLFSWNVNFNFKPWKNQHGQGLNINLDSGIIGLHFGVEI